MTRESRLLEEQRCFVMKGRMRWFGQWKSEGETAICVALGLLGASQVCAD